MCRVNFEESLRVMLDPRIAQGSVDFARHSIDFINLLILFECEGQRVHRRYVDLITNRGDTINLKESASALINAVVVGAAPIEDLFTKQPDIIDNFKNSLPEELRVGLFPYLLLFEIYFDRGADIDLADPRAVQVFISIYALITRLGRSLGILSYCRPEYWKEKLGFLMKANTPDDIYDNEYPLYLAGFFQSHSLPVSFFQETGFVSTRKPDFLVSGQDIPLIGETKKLRPRDIRDFVQNIGSKIENASSQIGTETTSHPHSVGIVFVNIPESALEWGLVLGELSKNLEDLRWYLNTSQFIGCLVLQQRSIPKVINSDFIDIYEKLNTIIVKNEECGVDDAAGTVARLSEVFCATVF